jgi:short-subunit dehydrogenase
MPTLLADKRIWLIGASEGIGEALAKKLVFTKKAKVIISARNEEKLTKLHKELSPNHSLVAPLDVKDYESIKKAYLSIKDAWGGVDIVIYNAGMSGLKKYRKFVLSEALETLDVNLLGAFRALSLPVKDFVDEKRGHIVLVGSVAGYGGLPASTAYGASKAGVIHMAEGLRLDLAPVGVKVQVVNPGFVETRLTKVNDFEMPALISAEKAADYIIKGIKADKFEIHFPKKFTLLLKFLQLLPYSLYFKAIRSQTKNLKYFD